MSETEKKDETTEALPQITPAEAEERVSSAVAEVVPEESDSLLIEEDGNSFWVIQRVFWGILKTAGLLAILLFLIWLIWRPGSFLSTTVEPEFSFESNPVATPVVDQTEKKDSWWSGWFTQKEATPSVPAETDTAATTPAVNVPAVVPNLSDSASTDPVDIAYELETARVLLVRGIIPDSVQWLREAKTIGDISMQMLRQESPQSRSAQVEEIIAAADDLFVRSVNLRAQLQSEINYFLEEGNKANTQTAQIEKEIEAALAGLDPVPVESLVAEKIISQQNSSFFMSNAKIRDTLLRNIQTFDHLLRQQAIPLLNPATEIRAN